MYLNPRRFKAGTSVLVQNDKVSPPSHSLVIYLFYCYYALSAFAVLVLTFFIQEAANSKVDKEINQFTEATPKEDMATPVDQKVQSTLDAYVTTKREMRRGERRGETR